MRSPIRPLGDKLLVARLEAEGKTSGGIILPDNARERPKEGKVVATGEGRPLKDGTRAPMQVRKGDRIVFNSYAGTEVSLGREEYLILSEEDVLAVVG